ncbi:DMT family transporter [Amycolatopsis sp. GM8]|uniref:DMT family transporter n=1 Tax=Amycolatopsis sp. GM8 TaxID=2896530 RepID=UPI001F18F677|nr:DMT family transporter [Amycolatopsis sp. GM8]
MTTVGVACAVCAAVASGVGARLQHKGVRAATQHDPLSLRSLAKLGRNPGWSVGLVVLLTGTALQIIALTYAPVIVVAPLVVLALPVVVVLGRRFDVTSLAAVGAVSMAVGIFVALSSGASSNPRLPPSDVLGAAQIVAVTVIVLGTVAAFTRRLIRCVALAAAAGASYALVSVLIREIAFTVRTLGLAELPWTALFGAVATILLAAWLVQLAYASGPPEIVVGCGTTVNPLIATVLGMTILGEAPAANPLTLVELAACGAVAIAGVAVLTLRHRQLLVSSPSRRSRYSRST